MNEVKRRIARGVVRGTVAAMAMTGMRQITTGLGLVEQTPPDAIIKQRASGLLVRMPSLAFFVAKRQIAVVELAHWLYGAGTGAAFAMLPDSVRRQSTLAGLGYGLLTAVRFELSHRAGLEWCERVGRLKAWCERMWSGTECRRSRRTVGVWRGRSLSGRTG